MDLYDHTCFSSPAARAEWKMTGWFVLIGFVAVLLTPSSVSIDVNPRVLTAGSTVRLRCTVPRHPDNRQLDYGIEGYTQSSVPLEGDSAPVTRQVFIDHVPCGAGDAYCVITRADGKTSRAVAGLTIAGCSEE